MIFSFSPHFDWFEIWSACNATTLVNKRNRINSIFWMSVFYVVGYHYFKEILKVKYIFYFPLYIQTLKNEQSTITLIDKINIFSLATLESSKTIALQMESNCPLCLELLFLSCCAGIPMSVSEIFSS